MKHYVLSLFCLFSFSLTAQEFYDLETIQTIEITFAESNWDQLLDNEKQGDENYILAQSVSINGTVLDSVGVKYKGNSTYNANQTKNPFHIELDTYKDHSYQSYKDIKLSNVAKDPSFLREVLSYKILRNYMDAPLSNYANVYVNGTLIGLFSNSEAVSKRFVNSRYGSKNNTFVKCNPPDGAGPQTNDFPNLVYIGTDSASYYDAYEMKSDAGWKDLIDLCENLANDVNSIEDILDVDRALWMLAFDNALVNLDSYIGRFIQNYYLYKDDNGRFVPVVWDLNESFGRFSDAGSGPPLGNTTAKQQMDHLLHDGDADFPLVQKLLSVPLYKRMYLAHFKTIMEEQFSDGSYFEDGQELQGIIDDAVNQDENKFFTYANFISNITTDVNSGGGPGGGSTPGITNLMDGRYDYLSGLADFNLTAPSIAMPILSVENPLLGDMVNVTVDVESANTVYIGFRYDSYDRFTRTEMFDDGNHNDGAANDGTYGFDINVEELIIEYYLYADNDEAGLFSPRRAEHEFHIISAKVSDSEVGDIVINELLASNDVTASDADGEFDDWVELYNNSDNAVDISGYKLSDDFASPEKLVFPEGSIIEAKAYLIVWADGDVDQEGLHADFKISASGESVFLFDSQDVVVDEISFGEQITDISYGRFPNGTGAFQSMTPTFNAENNISTSLYNVPNSLEWKVFPNPNQGEFLVEFDDLNSRIITVIDLVGKVVLEREIIGTGAVDIKDYQKGIYFVRCENTVMKVLVQ